MTDTRQVICRLRYWLGRHLVHLGLRIMPQGRVRSELYQLLDEGARGFMQPSRQRNKARGRLAPPDPWITADTTSAA